MCGIIGIIEKNGGLSQDILSAMTDTLTPRGPDDKGLLLSEEGPLQLGFGHRRLSILDLSYEGHQPMQIEDGDYTIIHNGEIYNFLDIRKELEQDGITFRSQSDTEVILRAYQKWGTDCVTRFIGMFAFAIHDKKANAIHICRDRAGVKPLYYFHSQDRVLFGSELKSFMAYPYFPKTINADALGLFFKHGFIPAPQCIFKNTFKLLPGHYLSISLPTLETSLHKYWDVIDAYNQPKWECSEDEALSKLEPLLKDAFNYRLISDVPVGVFLSSGYDSTAVAALLQTKSKHPIRTFTIGFNESYYDEAPTAKKIAAHLGTDHNDYYCSANDALGLVDELPHIYDEPFGDSSALPTLLVSKIAREHVKVALSADGGDELFCGYRRYNVNAGVLNALAKWPMLSRPLLMGLNALNPDSNRIQMALKALQNENVVDGIGRVRIECIFSQKSQYDALINQDLSDNLHTYYDDFPLLKSSNDVINKMLAIDYKTYMADDVLHKVDRATMAVSLEGREPFLDHRIVEFTATLPSHLKQHGPISKYLLKQLVHRYVPQSMMSTQKKGFGIPIHTWLSNDLKDKVSTYLDPKLVAKHGVLKPKTVSELLVQFNHNPNDIMLATKIWHILMVNMWCETWL